jgi:ATP-dependent Clp endopeptidase proteolytic subunit ClpP
MVMRRTICGLVGALSAFSGASAYVSTFVPKKGIAPPAPKAVSGLKTGSSRRSSMRNDIKMMPIGVPKVAYRVPGGMGAEWVDIYNRLYRERIIFLGSEIDDELANQIIGVMLYLDEEDSSKPIYLYINSPGGSVSAGMAIYDTMQYIPCDVSTVCFGMAASMGAFLLGAGAPGKRRALPNARIMIHQPLGGAQGQAADIEIQAKEILFVKACLNKYIAEYCDQPEDKIEADCDRDFFMTAEEAVDYGIIDEMISTKTSHITKPPMPIL